MKKPGSPLTRWLACAGTLFAASLALAAPEAHAPAASAAPQAGHHGPHWAHAGANGPRHCPRRCASSTTATPSR